MLTIMSQFEDFSFEDIRYTQSFSTIVEVYIKDKAIT